MCKVSHFSLNTQTKLQKNSRVESTCKCKVTNKFVRFFQNSVITTKYYAFIHLVLSEFGVKFWLTILYFRPCKKRFFAGKWANCGFRYLSIDLRNITIISDLLKNS